MAVLELSLVKVDIMPRFIALAEDWRSFRVATMDFVSSYSNFNLVDLVSDELKYKIEEVAVAVAGMLSGEAAEEEEYEEPPTKRNKAESAGSTENPYAGPWPSSSSGVQRRPTPSQPSFPPPPRAPSTRLPPPPPAQELGDDLLDDESWAVIVQYQIDHQAVLIVKRLASRSLDAAKRVLRKLTTKTDIAKPSQFISIAAKNAIDKLDRESAA